MGQTLWGWGGGREKVEKFFENVFLIIWVNNE